MNVLHNKSKVIDNQGSQNDYQIVKKLAATIGLSEISPNKQQHSLFISNQSPKKQKIRRLNHSDLRHLERQQVSQQVRFKNKMMSQIQKTFRSKSYRKNSVKDVFIQFEKPQNNPMIILKNKKAICQIDSARANLISFTSQQLRLRAEEKQRRSNILGDLSQNLVRQQDFLAMHKSINNTSKIQKGWFKNPLAIPKFSANKTQSANKLLTSFDFSKFNLKHKKEGLYLQSNTYERNVQTSQTSRRKIRLRCNSNNKFEILLSKTENQSFKLFQFQDQLQG